MWTQTEISVARSTPRLMNGSPSKKEAIRARIVSDRTGHACRRCTGERSQSGGRISRLLKTLGETRRSVDDTVVTNTRTLLICLFICVPACDLSLMQR